MQDIIEQTGFSSEWVNSKIETKNSTDDFYAMRGWQHLAFNKLKDKSCMILNAPMGGGKSWLMCLLSAFKMKQDSKLRTIIIVPQTIIAVGFIDAKMIMPDYGERLHWQIIHNLCDDSISIKSTSNYLIKWLEQKRVSDFNDRAIICTHATLIAVYRKIRADNKLHLWNDILLFIDEAHHVKNVDIESIDGRFVNNALGEVVSYFLENQEKNLQIGLVTASFFRGDRATLLTDSMEEYFKDSRFNLPYDQYLRSMNYLKSFSFDFLLCNQNYIQAIDKVLKTRTGKDIIYIPYRNSASSTDNKYQETHDIIQLYGEFLDETQNGLIIIQGENRQFKILNLVDENFRKEKKNYLAEKILKIDSSALDVIITLGMFKEGANWIFADRAIIVGTRSSFVDILQMIGRLFRDVENKGHVEIIQLLPFSFDQQNKDAFRENLNDYIKAIFASLLLENILNPVKIKSMQKIECELNKDDNQGESLNWLSRVLPDDDKQQKIIEEVKDCLFNIRIKNPDTDNNIPLLYEEFNKIIPTIFQNYKIVEYQQEVAQQIWATLTRRTMRMQGLCVKNIDFNIVHEIHPLEFLPRYTSGICDINTLSQFQEVMQRHTKLRSFEEARKFARLLSLKGYKEWLAWSRTDARPIDIPATPDEVYIDKGWLNWTDWLGTGKIPRIKNKRNFEEARMFARGLGLSGGSAWQIWLNTNVKPNDIPSAPAIAYAKEGWVSWGDWLGTDNVASKNRKYASFENARSFARSLNLKSRNEWQLLSNENNLPADIPAGPSRVYADKGWIGWPDWLGTDEIAYKYHEWQSFKEARDFVRKLSIQNQKDWFKYAKSQHKPIDIPAYPSEVYVDKGWVNWGDWLGTGVIAKQNYTWRSFEQAREFVRSLELKNFDEWQIWSKTDVRPLDIPANPYRAYANKGWISLGDWLGIDSIAPYLKVYRSYNEACEFAHLLKLTKKEDWIMYIKGLTENLPSLPKDIPASPRTTYQRKDYGEAWQGWGHFLGTGTIAPQNREYKSFEEAREFAKNLELANSVAWRAWIKTRVRPLDIPATPDRMYKNKGWNGWQDFLGVKK